MKELASSNAGKQFDTANAQVPSVFFFYTFHLTIDFFACLPPPLHGHQFPRCVHS